VCYLHHVHLLEITSMTSDIYMFSWYVMILRCGDGAGNTIEENSSIFLIRMH